MGILWAILESGGPLLLEEPEIHLHQGVIRVIPQMIYGTQRRSGRQVMISTHATDLLSDSGIGMDEVVVLEPSAEGTNAKVAGEIEEVRLLVEGGLSIGDALMPRTTPEQAVQLAMFGSK